MHVGTYYSTQYIYKYITYIGLPYTTTILELDFDKIMYSDTMINLSLNSQFALEL
jgi:hypothetical protein